jgi:hypothetical protein
VEKNRATVNPAKGSITVAVGSADESADLPTSHLLAPWPADEHCEEVAVQALSGMGWTVVGGGKFTGSTGDPDATFVLDVVPTRRA